MNLHDKLKVSVIFGTRPEAIKLAPVVKALKVDPHVSCNVCVTAQHREMLDQVLRVFQIIPDTDLNLMQHDQTLCGLASKSLGALEKYLEATKPDLILVQGDTTTVFVSSLAAFYNNIPVGHVEAGLRTGNLLSPWPEEANRTLTSDLASMHFAPTEIARQNLLREGISSERVTVTGNTVIDALFLALEKVRAHPPSIRGLNFSLSDGIQSPPVVLVTGHRRENFGTGLETVCEAIAELAQRFSDVHFVYPVHLNPNVRSTVLRVLGAGNGAGGHAPNVHLIDPLPYLEFVALMAGSTLILTDSGGIQEEAPSLGKPVLVTRNTTERPEAIRAGVAKLVGTNPQLIIQEVSRLLNDCTYYESMATKHNPFGDGKATERIILAIKKYLALPFSAGCAAIIA